MDRRKLSHIDEELESSEVAALCFLCRDIVNRKRLEGIGDAKGLFLRLEEKGLLGDDSFLIQLLHTIHRADLLSLLETDSRRSEETDAHPVLSRYRVMLYKVYENMTKENLEKMKFLVSSKLGRRQVETCKTALDVFAEMEKIDWLSNTKVDELHTLLQGLDQQLACTVQSYMDDVTLLPQDRLPMRYTPQSTQPQSLCGGEGLVADAEPSTLSDQTDYYPLNHNPHGLCVVINNEKFTHLNERGGTQEDEKALHEVFTKLGFSVVVHSNLTADDIRLQLQKLCKRNFLEDDALVVCVLSHGDKGCVFGTDGRSVSLRELTLPFTSNKAPTLAGKPKLFFIQACQGSGYQRGSVPYLPMPKQEEGDRESRLEEDAGPLQVEAVPWDADFLLGMATVPECKSFRNTSTGSIYIQQLCAQLRLSAQSQERDDILSVLTRVNREVSKGEYLCYKQMPEPKYTLTKKLVLKYA